MGLTILTAWQTKTGHWALSSVLGAGLCLMWGSSFAAPGPWKLDIADADNDIEIHTRKRDDGFTEFRGTTRLKTSLSSLVALLRDVESLPNWAYRTTRAVVVERVSARESIIYSVAGLPWPFKDRDLIVRSRLQQDPVSLAVTVTAHALPEYLPVEPAYVRVPFLESSWAFVPLKDGIVEVRFKGFGDGGGSLSKGILNWFSALVVSEAPHQTLLGMRRLVRQQQYQRARLGIIREPIATSTVKNDARVAPQGMSKRLSMISPSSK